MNIQNDSSIKITPDIIAQFSIVAEHLVAVALHMREHPTIIRNSSRCTAILARAAQRSPDFDPKNEAKFFVEIIANYEDSLKKRGDIIKAQDISDFKQTHGTLVAALRKAGEMLGIPSSFKTDIHLRRLFKEERFAMELNDAFHRRDPQTAAKLHIPTSM